ncbi:MAG: fused MFS/spermidine synthase [Candidatus Brocadiaceae bacterium]|nr:fused MFS/spermidine synthase [Candidatus Brocadiaceae bacterium]
MSVPDVPTGGPWRRAAPLALLLLFFLSGAAALIYQIVWARQLALVFGVTIYANSAVVTAFMAGLALGSLYIGRLADRWDRPLRLFALLEVGIGVFGACFPLLADAATPLYVAFYGAFGANHYVMSLVRFALSFAMLLIPTALMGGTLPVLARAYVRHRRRLGGEVAGLYSVNNLGAVVGCVLAGYVFLEFLGQAHTLLLAAALNVSVGAGAMLLDRLMGGPEPAASDAAPAAADAAPAAADSAPGGVPRAVKVALWVFGIEGFTSLAYQMAWTRLLIFFVATNTYAITTITATFLVGLSLGAFLVRGLVDRTDPYRLLAAIEVGIGLSALVTIPLLPWLMRFYGTMEGALRLYGWGAVAGGQFVISMVVILIPTTLMGATMPVVSRIYVPALKRLGRRMGVIGCLDTVGSIFGAFVGGFIMIPVLGIQRSIIVTAVVNLALGAWMLAARPAGQRVARRRPAFLLSAALVVAAPALLLMPRLELIHATGATRNRDMVRVLDYHEDVESTVSVLETAGFALDLYVNETGVARTTRHDRPSHEMIAHVPLLLHPAPQRALLIGFGIGFTSQAAVAHGVEVDVVELSPGVRRVSGWFKKYNGDVLSDPRVHLRIDDGRNYVLGTRERYDVVQAGIIHPGLNAGNAGFYGVDFYRQCKRILAPGGIICQWLPLHSMPEEDFRMLIRSFLVEFPHASVWFKYTADFCILIGTEGPLRIDFAELERRLDRPAVKERLAANGVVDACDFLSAFCGEGDDLRRAVGQGPLNTDDIPIVEFHCSRSYPMNSHVRALFLLAGMRRSPWDLLYSVPAGREAATRESLERWVEGTTVLTQAVAEGLMMEYLQDFDDAFARAMALFDRALAVNPQDATARFLRRYYAAVRTAAVARWHAGQGPMGQARARLLLEPLVEGGEPVTAAEAEAHILWRMLHAPGADDAGR